ncbi:MAG: 1-deoxy-D-xylulose-5-phosphate synthase [Lachnospiraceae bacterium]
MTKLLDKIKKENDIKKISPEQYGQLAEEIRQFLVEKVSKTGGHLASNLGVVELTMALHIALDLPKDKIIYDVGHQSYVHKILTGRKERFDTLREYKGLCGFPRIYESECDTFGTGHSSTSISAALGMAQARDLCGGDETIVAVIGDGALSGGMAYEALNNMAKLRKNKKGMIVILNDNKMSISENVGGMSTYLAHLRSDMKYMDFKENLEKHLRGIPKVGEGIAKTMKKSKDSIRQMLMKEGTFFEEMDIEYIGPIDGSNIFDMVRAIKGAKRIGAPVLIHVLTNKGEGYAPAKENPSKFHGIDPFDPKTGEILKKKELSTYTDIFGRKIVDFAKKDKKVVAITAAMESGTGLLEFAKQFPERFFDVGIAEEHAVTFAAGMAAAGMKPVFAVYSTFLQRAYDQILHDVCMQKLPVVFAVDRSGIVGKDGETHQGIYDISYLSSIPGMTVVAPKNRYEMSRMLDFCISFDGPIAIKYPRGTAYYGLKEHKEKIVYGKSEVIQKGEKIAILAVGSMVKTVKEAIDLLEVENINPTFINVRFIKPIDEALIHELNETYDSIITVEENIKTGSFGQQVAQYLCEIGPKASLKTICLPDIFLEHGDVEKLKESYGLSREEIANKIRANWNV